MKLLNCFATNLHIGEASDAALRKTQQATLKTQRSLAGLNLGQALIIAFGISASLALAAKRVISGDMTVGDFVLVNTHILQLYVPLNFLGTYYRMIKQCMVDVESMFKLLKEEKDVNDEPGAKDLVLKSKEDAKVELPTASLRLQPKGAIDPQPRVFHRRSGDEGCARRSVGCG